MKNTIKYTEVTKKSYETSDVSIEFKVEINGIVAKGWWQPCRSRYVKDGIDVNQLDINRRKIDIFTNGGTRTAYEIRARLELATIQSKDLRFTGRTLSIKNLKRVFVDKIKAALIDEQLQFTEDFINTFNIIKDNG